MMLRCRFLGHKWKFAGRSGTSDKFGCGYYIYECERCGQYCRVHEKDYEKNEILQRFTLEEIGEIYA